MGPLHPVQSGQRVAHRELLRVAGEDAAHERIRHVVQHLLIEPAPHESGYALLDQGVAGIHQGLPEDGELGAVRQQAGREQVLRGDREGQQLLLPDDVAVPRHRRRRHDARLQPELDQHGPERRLRGGHRVGTQLGQIALAALGPHHPADPFGGLVDDDPLATLLEAIGRGETSEPPADDRYRAHAEPRAASNAASSVSPCTAEVNAASKAEGARYTPPSSMAWKNAP